MPSPIRNPHGLQTESFFSQFHANLPILRRISEKLIQMSQSHNNMREDLLRESCKSQSDMGRFEIITRILESIPREIARNRQELCINSQTLSDSVKMIALVKGELMLNREIDTPSLTAFHKTIFDYQRECQNYLDSCKKLYLCLESFLQIPAMRQIYHLLSQSIQILVSEIKLFESTISVPLKSLLLSRAEQESFRSAKHMSKKYLKKILFLLFLMLGIIVGILIISQLLANLMSLNDWHDSSWIGIMISYLYTIYVYSNIDWFYNPLYSLVGINLILHPLKILQTLYSRDPYTILALFATQLFILVPSASVKLGKFQQDLSRKLRGKSDETQEILDSVSIAHDLEQLKLHKVVIATGDSRIDSMIAALIKRAGDFSMLIKQSDGSGTALIQGQEQRVLQSPEFERARQDVRDEFWKIVQASYANNMSDESVERLGLLRNYNAGKAQIEADTWLQL